MVLVSRVLDPIETRLEHIGRIYSPLELGKYNMKSQKLKF